MAKNPRSTNEGHRTEWEALTELLSEVPLRRSQALRLARAAFDPTRWQLLAKTPKEHACVIRLPETCAAALLGIRYRPEDLSLFPRLARAKHSAF